MVHRMKEVRVHLSKMLEIHIIDMYNLVFL